MNSPGSLEIRCAQLEAYARDEIAPVLYKQSEGNRFPRLSVGGDADGLRDTTIRDARWFFYLSAKTPLGNPIGIEVEIAHDEAWVPYVAITSTEQEDVDYTVIGLDPTAAIRRVKTFLLETIERAAARVKLDRDNLPQLLAGRTEFAIYV